MSSLLSISLFCDAFKETEVFVRLLHRRLFPRSREISGFTYEGHKSPDRKRLVSAIDDLESRILTNNDSHSHHFRMIFSCESGRSIPIEAILYGKLFDNSIPYRDSGSIRIIATVNDLSRPLWEQLRVDNSTPSPSQDAGLIDPIQHDIEDWFYTVCGVYDELDNLDPLIKHGVMYLECGCPSPVGASMLYHRQFKDFLVDYQRIYKEYQFGIVGVALYSSEIHNIYSESKKISNTPYGRNHLESFYQQFDRPSGVNILSFLNNLTFEKVNKTQHISLELVSQWLSLHCGSDIELNYFRLHDDSMLLISSNPLISLWKCYKSFYEDMLCM